jgi:hypothetical protein
MGESNATLSATASKRKLVSSPFQKKDHGPSAGMTPSEVGVCFA